MTAERTLKLILLIAAAILALYGMARAANDLTGDATDDDIAILTIAYESSGEPYTGQVAVASVIRTRMLERGQSARAVCMAPKQFSCHNQGARLRTRTQTELESARRAWMESRPGKYNHYCRYDVRPSWVKAAKNSVRIGNHIFYEL